MEGKPAWSDCTLYFKNLEKILEVQNESFDFVCAVDEAWGMTRYKRFMGGIGGNIKGSNNALLHVFFGPVQVSTAEEAEIEAIMYVVSVSSTILTEGKRMVIYSDSVNPLEIIRIGLRTYVP